MALFVTASTLGIGLLIVSGHIVHRTITTTTAGVVIVDSLYGKKGPDYAYSNAFNEPLHDGVEFTIIDDHGKWSLVELSDGRQCWLLNDQTTQISW